MVEALTALPERPTPARLGDADLLDASDVGRRR